LLETGNRLFQENSCTECRKLRGATLSKTPEKTAPEAISDGHELVDSLRTEQIPSSRTKADFLLLVSGQEDLL